MNSRDSNAHHPERSGERSDWNVESLTVAAVLAGYLAGRSRLARWALLAAAGGWLWKAFSRPATSAPATEAPSDESEAQSYVDEAWQQFEAELQHQAPPSEPDAYLSAVEQAVSIDLPVVPLVASEIVEAEPITQADLVAVLEPVPLPVEDPAPVAMEVAKPIERDVPSTPSDDRVQAVAEEVLSSADASEATPIEAVAPVAEVVAIAAVEEALPANDTPVELIVSLVDEVAEPVALAVETVSEPEPVVAVVEAPSEEPVPVVEAPVAEIAAVVEPVAELPTESTAQAPEPAMGAPENLTIAAMLAGERAIDLAASEGPSAAERDLDHAFNLLARDSASSAFVAAASPLEFSSPFAFSESSVPAPRIPTTELAPEAAAPELSPFEQLAALAPTALAAQPVSEPTPAPISKPLVAAEIEPAEDTEEPLGKSAAWLLGLEPMPTMDAIDDAIPVVRQEAPAPPTSSLAVGKEIPDSIEIPEPPAEVTLHPALEQFVPKDAPLRPITKGLLNKVLETVTQRPKSEPLAIATAPVAEPAPAAESSPIFRLPPPRAIPRPASWIAAELAREAEEKARAGISTPLAQANVAEPAEPMAATGTSEKKALINFWK